MVKTRFNSALQADKPARPQARANNVTIQVDRAAVAPARVTNTATGPFRTPPGKMGIVKGPSATGIRQLPTPRVKPPGMKELPKRKGK